MVTSMLQLMRYTLRCLCDAHPLYCIVIRGEAEENKCFGWVAVVRVDYETLMTNEV